jgi:hypothetical protein
VRKVSRFLHRLYGCASVRIIGAFLILNFSIPESVGTWSTVLKPIPVNDPTLKMAIGDDLPGIAGVVAVLMEQDGWPDSFATVGYSALVNAVQLGVAQAAASFQFASMPPTPEQIAAQIENVKALASTMVTGAIEAYMSGTQTVWYGSLGNNDDEIGTQARTILTAPILLPSQNHGPETTAAGRSGETSSIWTAPSSRRRLRSIAKHWPRKSPTSMMT